MEKWGNTNTCACWSAVRVYLLIWNQAFVKINAQLILLLTLTHTNARLIVWRAATLLLILKAECVLSIARKDFTAQIYRVSVLIFAMLDIMPILILENVLINVDKITTQIHSQGVALISVPITIMETPIKCNVLLNVLKGN